MKRFLSGVVAYCIGSVALRLFFASPKPTQFKPVKTCRASYIYRACAAARLLAFLVFFCSRFVLLLSVVVVVFPRTISSSLYTPVWEGFATCVAESVM